MDLSVSGPWSDGSYAVIAYPDVISFVHHPGGQSDDALRARVNAPADAAVLRSSALLLDLGPAAITWPCMVCGDWRPDAQISVAHWRAPGFEDEFPDRHWNVRYCNDRDDCTNKAEAGGTWPPSWRTEVKEPTGG